MDPEARLGGGRFLVAALLGEGSQGQTYAATEVASGRAVAIKRFDVRGARSWKDVELAEREVRTLATLDHPLVPRYLEHFEEDGALYLVMDRVEGETLEAIRKREGALPEAEVRRFLVCADRALTYLHGRGAPVVHRDIKPSNVVRRPDGAYVLVDFGAVAERLQRRGASTIVGTVGYMAPEQVQGRALPASDVYAVGATALAALAGIDADELPHKGLGADVRAAAGGRASPELVAALERMLVPDPELRAASVGAALDGVLTGSPAVASRVPPPRRARGAERSPEDAAVKALRGLSWALWGVGWVIVSLVFGEMLGHPELIPIVMSGWLALNLIVGWHKGAILRAAVRQWNAESSPRAKGSARPRVVIDASQPQVRVHTSALEHEHTVAPTEVQLAEDEARPRRAR